jgi:hypothetical protein
LKNSLKSWPWFHLKMALYCSPLYIWVIMKSSVKMNNTI